MNVVHARYTSHQLRVHLKRVAARRYATQTKASSPLRFNTAQRHDSTKLPSNNIRNVSLIFGGCVLLSIPFLLKSDARQSFVSGSTFWPFPSSSSDASSSRLETYTHNPLAISCAAFYPEANTTSDHKYLRISLPTDSSEDFAALNSDSERARFRIRSLYIKEPSLVIERAYTPLHDTFPGSASLAAQSTDSSVRDIGAKRGSVDLLIKRYADGELSRYLHRLTPGAVVEARGPIDTWSLTGNHGVDATVPNEIVLIVGGTGITPAYQLLTSVLDGAATRSDAPTDMQTSKQRPSFKLLYAAPDMPNSLLLPQLHAMAKSNADRLNVNLFIESIPGSTVSVAGQSGLCLQTKPRLSWNPLQWFTSSSKAPAPVMVLTSEGQEKATKGGQIPVYDSRITPAHLSHILGDSTQSADSSKRLILVCGPDGMVSYLAGPKSRDGRTQGPLQGVLASLGYKQEQVFKL